MVNKKILPQSLEDFEAWIKSKGGQEKLIEALERKFGEKGKVSQSAVSFWITKKLVPVARRPQLKELGWEGPFDWTKNEEGNRVVTVPPELRNLRNYNPGEYARKAWRIVRQAAINSGVDILSPNEKVVTLTEELIDSIADGVAQGDEAARAPQLLRKAEMMFQLVKNS